MEFGTGASIAIALLALTFGAFSVFTILALKQTEQATTKAARELRELLDHSALQGASLEIDILSRHKELFASDLSRRDMELLVQRIKEANRRLDELRRETEDPNETASA